MTDRLVRIVAMQPSVVEENEAISFSDLVAFPSIVLLGDPGAGKTHLFRHAAAVEGGVFVPARSFINRPPELGSDILYIDALDEKRVGRGDHATINDIVSKLFEVAPRKVRISCRAQDWLGDTDLAALRDYFDTRGGFVVVALDPLTIGERDKILATAEMEEPAAFAAEASARGLDYLLTNPQNLLMLCNVVRGVGWPATRSDLYSSMSEILLAEHNRNKVHAGEGIFSARELLDAAGAVCAARLISDVEAVTRAEFSNDASVPSYRTLTIEDRSKVGACLGRRLFVTTATGEAVDYVHRTVAEYLAAAWLTKRIRAGLPFGRVRTLIGIDGHPTSELRGVHAWLAVLLTEHAGTLINADPYGVLSYGDPASLTPTLRKCVLRALGKLSETDPWFLSGTWQLPALGTLATADMVSELRAILQSKEANFALRSCALQALIHGAPLPELMPDLDAILVDKTATYSERSDALDALARLGTEGEALLGARFDGGLEEGADALRLKAEILIRLYGKHFKPADVGEYLAEVLRADDEVPGGTLWQLGPDLPNEDVLAILDKIPSLEKKEKRKAARRNASELAYLIDRLLLRALNESASEITGRRLWAWLSTRRRLREGWFSPDQTVCDALGRHRDLLLATVQPAVEQLVLDQYRWDFINRIREATMRQVDEADLMVALLGSTQVCNDTAKQAFLFELTLNLSFQPTDKGLRVFEALSELAQSSLALQDILNRNLCCPLEDWREQQSQSRAERDAKTMQRRERSRADFEVSRSSIERGAHKGWMGWLAELYLARFRDVEKKLSPGERIAVELGHENAAIALDGLLAVPLSDDIPPLQEVVETLVDGKYFKWWLAIIAGLDEAAHRGIGTTAVLASTLQTSLVLGARLLVFSGEADTRRTWREQFVAAHPEMARDAYMTLVTAELARGEEHISGLHTLLRDDAFAAFRCEVALQLLQAFPNAAPSTLESILSVALETQSARGHLIALAGDVMAGGHFLADDQRQLWLATAYLLDPTRYQSSVQAVTDPGLLWRLRDLSGSDRRSRVKNAGRLDVKQLGFLAAYAARQYPNCGHPENGWSGDQNPWDGADFVRNLISQISAVATNSATAALEGLIGLPELSTYIDSVRHALANQRARRREAEYRQPDWRQTVDALNNGAPASSVDLHALVCEHLRDANSLISGSNADLFKKFWNEDQLGRVTTPKVEESCRDVLMDLLRPRLTPLGIALEPEGHMAADKRADMIALSKGSLKAVVELKRDTHADIWTAATCQLDRFYTRDPGASGYGVYAVFWFGAKRKGRIPAAPDGWKPTSAHEFEIRLRATVPEAHRHRIEVLVIDVSELAERA